MFNIKSIFCFDELFIKDNRNIKFKLKLLKIFEIETINLILYFIIFHIQNSIELIKERYLNMILE